MCGIIGYCGLKPAAPEVFEGLKRLEYRGYDSAGVACVSAGGLHIAKKRGRVCELESCVFKLAGNVAVGHTRWATHGKPSDKNAHPHVSGKIAIVHNGIIENFAELRAGLIKEGFVFSSETDSEVIAHLVAKYYDGDLLAAVEKSVRLLKGSYALMAICADFDGIVAARLKSPLILGYGSDGMYFSSDEPALAGLCDKISVLKDGDFAVITQKSAHIFDKNLQKVNRPVEKNEAARANLELSGCPHYMLKELREAPAAVKNTAEAFRKARGGLSRAFGRVSRVTLTGCGTAYHAALVGKRYFEELCRIPAEAEIAGEFRYKRPIIGKGCALIAVSQSGETADTVEAARLSKSLGAIVVAVTNSPHSQLAGLADFSVPVCAGPEICVAATKSYSGQVAALYMLANMLAGESDEKSVAALSAVSSLCFESIKSLECDENIERLAKMCAGARGVYFLGRDTDYYLALEAALKLKEVSYVPCGGYPAGELKHGTLALIDGRTVSVLLSFDKRLKDKCENALEQVTARGGKAAVVSNLDFCGVGPSVKLPECEALLSPVLCASALHILAYKTAVFLGRDPDKPRNLAKSVTVE